MAPMTLPSSIPVKIYYSIREVSDYTGVEPHVLRYWETKFSKLRPKRVGGNQRKYTRADLELIMEIIRLLYREGYTLDGAEKRLRSVPKGSVSEEAAADQGLQEIKQGLEQILALIS